MLIDQPAPIFQAKACMSDGSFEMVKLDEYKGKYVIFFFYPADFTFVCASEVPGFDKMVADFRAKNCELIACSTDTVHAHKAWKLFPTSEGGIGPISYPMVADTTKEIARAYDVLDNNGLCVRGLFLIDKEGIVRAEHKNCDPLGRNLEEAMRLLDALQFHEKAVKSGNPEVCPANWKKGKKAMKPTLESVGQFNKSGGMEEVVSNKV